MQNEKKPVKRIDIYNEQFNYYFVEQLNQINEQQSKLIPTEILYKIFHGGKVASAERLSFNEKMWILSVVFRKNITIMVDDEKNGIGQREFSAAIKANKGKLSNSELLKDMRIKTAFVIADKELMSASLYMNHVSCSPIYSLIKEFVANVNHKTNVKFLDSKKGIDTLLKFIVNYEANKKRLVLDYKLNMPRWYALIFFSTGEKYGNEFYNHAFKYSYNTTRQLLHREMKWLADNGFLLRRGVRSEYRYSLTSAGINLLNRVMDNFLLQF